jgi:outer membrane protein OmpA-like peptidoglycan-associated protein
MVLLVTAVLAIAVALHPRGSVEEVTVLPGLDGHVGTVIVERNGERHVLNRAYATSRTTAAGVTQRDAEEARKAFGEALLALPARPASFLLYFITGTDELTEESRGELQRILAELKRRPIPDVAVIAHTDTVGEPGANDVLSAQRAERVKKFLIEIGIASRRIQTSGRGEREPLVPTADGTDEPRNRRVEISVR